VTKYFVKWYHVLRCTGLHTGKDQAIQMVERLAHLAFLTEGRLIRIWTVFIFQLRENSDFLKYPDDAKHDCLGKHLACTNKYTTVQILNIERLLSQKRGKIHHCPQVWMDSFPR